MTKIVTRARKKELGLKCIDRSTQRELKCSHNPVKSVARSMSITERASLPSKA